MRVKVFICLLMVGLILAPVVTASDPSSTNYQLQDYSLGGSTTESGTGSSNYLLFGEAGGNDSLSGDSTNYTFDGGLAFAMQANIPQTPTLTNPVDYYDRLKFTLTPGEDPTDYTYAIAISKDNFATTQYISNDLTVVSTLEANDWQTYTAWGGASGAVVTGLDANTAYKIKVKSMQGEFTESEYSAEATASTELPHLTFSVNGNADMGVWREDNNYSSTAVSTLTTSTNAYNGYSVYAFATQPLTRQNGSETIANISGSYASPIAWLSGLGFGYTTNDTSIAGLPKWNENPCPGDSGPPLCYAPFSQTGPGDVVADHEAVLGESVISSEEFSLTYKVVTQATQTAGTYTTAIVYTVVPTY